MYFDSFSALLVMDGHGGYVWFCYGIATLVIAVLFWQPLAKKQQFLKQQAANLRRQKAMKASEENAHASR